MIKMHCMLCKQPRELTVEELKETAKFVRDNELDSTGYEDFIAAKVGRKCKGVDEKGTVLKLHKYVIDEEDREEVGDVARKVRSDVGDFAGHMSRVANIEIIVDEIKIEADKKIAELTKEKTEINDKLPTILTVIKEGKEKLFELVGDDREELWIK